MSVPRDPLSVRYDGVTWQILMRAARASSSRRGILAHVASPRGEFRNQDRGGRTRHERAFTRSAYYRVFRVPLNAGQVPDWSLKLTWGDELAPSSGGRLARPVTVRLYPRGGAQVKGPRWRPGPDGGDGFHSEVGNRIDD